jgi:hypothetical protein
MNDSKTAVQLKECSPKASESISKVSVADLLSFMQNLMQTLLDIAVHCSHRETRRKKCTLVKTMCSQHSVTWQTDAIGLQKCDLGLPSYILSPRQLKFFF